MRMGNFERGRPLIKYMDCHELYKNGWIDPHAVWDVDSGWSREACVRLGCILAILANMTEPSMCSGDAAFSSSRSLSIMHTLNCICTVSKRSVIFWWSRWWWTWHIPSDAFHNCWQSCRILESTKNFNYRICANCNRNTILSPLHPRPLNVHSAPQVWYLRQMQQIEWWHIWTDACYKAEFCFDTVTVDIFQMLVCMWLVCYHVS